MTNDQQALGYPFELAQPVWIKPEFFTDPRTFIVTGFHWGVFGGWYVEVVPENDTDNSEIHPAHYPTTVPQALPRLHPLHIGRLYFNGTGRAMKSIPGGKS